MTISRIILNLFLMLNIADTNLNEKISNIQNFSQAKQKLVNLGSLIADTKEHQEINSFSFEDTVKPSSDIDLNKVKTVISLNQTWLQISLPHYNVHFLSEADYNAKVELFKKNFSADHWKYKPDMPHFCSYKDYLNAILEKAKRLESGYNFQRWLFDAEPIKKIDVYYTAVQEDLGLICLADNMIDKSKWLNDFTKLTQEKLLKKIDQEVFKEIYWKKVDELATQVVNDYHDRKLYGSLHEDLRKLYDEAIDEQQFELKLRVDERKKVFNQVLMNNPYYFGKLLNLSNKSSEELTQSIRQKFGDNFNNFNIDITDGPFCTSATIAYYYTPWQGDTAMDMHEEGHLFQCAAYDKARQNNLSIKEGNWVHENLCAYMQSRTGALYRKHDFEKDYMKSPKSLYYIGNFKNIYELKEKAFNKYVRAFFYYIEIKYGIEKFKEFVQSIFKGFIIEEAVKDVLGKKLEDLNKEMNDYYYGIK